MSDEFQDAMNHDLISARLDYAIQDIEDSRKKLDREDRFLVLESLQERLAKIMRAMVEYERALSRKLEELYER